MKIHVVKNRTGRVIATYEPKEKGGLTLQPQLSGGQKVDELEVPKDYTSQLSVIYKKPAARKKSR